MMKYWKPIVRHQVCGKQHKYTWFVEFYLQSVLVRSANCVKTYAMACGRVLTCAPL
jgi:hypothetical protein